MIAQLALLSADIFTRIARGTVVIGITGTVREVQSNGTRTQAKGIMTNAITYQIEQSTSANRCVFVVDFPSTLVINCWWHWPQTTLVDFGPTSVIFLKFLELFLLINNLFECLLNWNCKFADWAYRLIIYLLYYSYMYVMYHMYYDSVTRICHD